MMFFYNLSLFIIKTVYNVGVKETSALSPSDQPLV